MIHTYVYVHREREREEGVVEGERERVSAGVCVD